MKVLLIDDEPDIRKIAKLSLQGVGRFETLVASSAAEGIEIAKRERPDLILLDMMMPEMDGLEALQVIRKTPALCHIPVVFLTAKVQRTEIEHCIQQGATGVIQKPFDPMTLPDEVRRIFDLSRPHEQGNRAKSPIIPIT